jgi:hypothetical protein
MKNLDNFKQFEFKLTDDPTVIKVKMNDHWEAFEYIERMLDDLGYERQEEMSRTENFLIINKITETQKLWYFQEKVLGKYFELPEELDNVVNKLRKLENIEL